MIRTRRNELIFLAVLVVSLTLVLYWNGKPPTETHGVAAADFKYQPLKVEDPELRVDLLERIRKFQYRGQHRNIFTASLPAPPRKAEVAKPAPPTPAPPPPLVVPVQYFGYVTDVRTGRRRAFFTNGDEVYIVNEGDVLLSRFRVLRVGNNSAEVQEISSGRRATLPLQEQGPST